MELKEFIIILLRYRRVFLAVVIACVVGAGMVSALRSGRFEASFSLVVRPKVIEKTNNFQFTDVLEASDRVARMTESWIGTQTWDVSTTRLGNQLISISFSAASQGEARGSMEILVKSANTFLASLSPSQGFGAFEALGSDFSFSRQNPRWAVSLASGLIAGIFIGFFAVLFKHYLA